MQTTFNPSPLGLPQQKLLASLEWLIADKTEALARRLVQYNHRPTTAAAQRLAKLQLHLDSLVADHSRLARQLKIEALGKEFAAPLTPTQRAA